MVRKDQHIPLTPLDTLVETPGYQSVIFARPKGFTFEAGDWVDIQFEGRQLKGGITYSLSSSPTEDNLRITFREGMSEFKHALQAITPNDQMFISQYGNDYGFQLKKHQSSTLIAGGVGVAPFRSMIKEMYDHDEGNDVTLVFLNQNDKFLFKLEFDLWGAALPNLTIHYVTTKDLSRKKREKLLLSLITSTHQNFYIAGPPGMVESNEHLLIDAGVHVRDIRIDSFGGY